MTQALSISVSRLLTIADANTNMNLHGGVNLQLTQEAGIIAATRYLRAISAESCEPILVRIESIDYIQPACIGDLVMALAAVVFTSEHTLAVNVQIITESLEHPKKVISKTMLWFVPSEIVFMNRRLNIKTISPFENIDEEYEKVKSLYLKNADFFNGLLKIRPVDDELPRVEASSLFSCKNAYTSYHLVPPSECNISGYALGGCLLTYMDELGAIIAIKHCRNFVVTVHVDSVNFFFPIFRGDIVIFQSKVVYTSSRTIEVLSKGYLNNLGDDSLILACEAYFIYASLSEDQKPLPVTPYVPIDDDEKRLFFEREEKYMDRKNARISSSK